MTPEVLSPITVAQMIEVDRLMIAEYGITLLQMMENAGHGLAALARHLLGGNTTGRKVVVLVGRGNNGGGAWSPPATSPTRRRR